ncbi:MAG: hypothetical protein ABJ310_00210 [Roseobacter sp.]
MANDYFISVIYPDYEIATGVPGATRIGSGTLDLGHTGLAYVNGTTGEIRYFDYGRYSGTEGIIAEPLVANNTGYNSINLQDVQNGNFGDLGALLSSTSGYNGVIQFNAFEVPDGSFENLNSTIDPAIGVENSFYGDWTFFNTCHNFMQDMAAVVGIDIDSLDGFAATPSGSAASLFSNSGGTLYSPSLGINIQFDENGQSSFLDAIDSGDITISQSIELLGQWALSYDDLPSANSIVSGITSLALIGNSGDLATLETTLTSLVEKYPELATHPEFLSRVAPALQALGGQDAWSRFLNDHLDGGCFGPEVPIDMWPLDSEFAPDPSNPNKQYDQDAVRAKVWKKPIELIQVGDIVVSFDDNENLVPGPVTRTFQNNAKILLDFHGTRVTPGHVYYRPDSKKSYKYETLIDVLRDDGVIKHQDSTLIRAATNVPVGSARDGFVRAVARKRKADGTFEQSDEGRIRLGTRFLVGTGKERKSWAVADLIERGGGVVGDDELIRVRDGEPMPFLWEFGDTLPKPEDFVLTCSGTTLEDIYKAAEWESQGPRLSAPMVLDRGPVQPLKGAALSAMLRNEPLDVVHSPMASAKPRRTLNRKQRKAMEAKQRRATKAHKRVAG